MGLFGNHSTSTTNAISYLTNTTLNTLVSIQQDCQATTSGLQNQQITVGTSDAVMSACINKFTPDECKTLMSSGLSVAGVTQQMTAVNVANCTMTNNTLTSLQAQITSAVDQRMNQSEDGVASALKDMVNLFNTKTNNTTNTSSSSNFVTQNFTQSSVQQLIATVSASQAQIISVTNASDSTVQNITQALAIQAMTTMLQNNQTTSQVLAELDQTSAQSTTQKTTGLTDLFSSLTSFGKYALIAGGIVIVLVVIAIVVWFCMSGEKPSDLIQSVSALTPEGAAAQAAGSVGGAALHAH